MASHYCRMDSNVYLIGSGSDTTPWTNPNSYEPERADPRVIHIFSRDEWADRSSLYRTEAVHDRIQQLVRLNRKEMWQDRVKWFCVAVAVFAAVYFAAQLLRIAL